MVSFDIAGKRVVIIGGSSGLGYVLAREFLSAKAVVTVVAEVPEIHDAALSLGADGGAAIDGILCDITDRAAVSRLGAVVGPADVLINNAALTVETPFADNSDKTAHLFQRTLDVNVAGLYWVAQVFAKTMNEGGRIIFTASFWAKTAGPRYSVYVASKHAIIGLVRTLAVELGPRGISVNAVCPHSMATEASLGAPPNVIAGATAQMCLRRGLIPPEDIAGTYLFLASPAASEITGQALSVDRGAAVF